MFKCIALLKRKRELSREAFIEYYENNHAVLIHSLLPDILYYRRNFVDLNEAFVFPVAAPIDFDVITEIGFADRAAYDLLIAMAAAPEIARRIAEDEENLFDRTATRMLIVEERGDVSAILEDGAPGQSRMIPNSSE